MKKRLLVALIIMLGFIRPVQAGDVSASAGLVLRQVTSVRAEGMGSAQTAVETDEAGAMGWNPAALQNNPYPDLSAVYYQGIGDNMYGSLDFSMRVNKELVFGSSLLIHDAGSFELTSDTGESSSLLAQRDILAAVTSAYQLDLASVGLALGVNAKFLQSTLLEKYAAFAAAIDLGVLVSLPDAWQNLKVGLAAKNIGTPLKYIEAEDPLPTYALFGAAYTLVKSESVGILLAGDAQFDLENKWQSHLGTEFRIARIIALRGGYKFGVDIGSVTIGLGMEFRNLQLDYTFSPSQIFNSTHVASMKYTFGPWPRPKEAEEVVETAQEEEYMPAIETKKATGPVEKIRTQVIQIRKAGGRPSEVVMNGGAEQEFRVGFQGVLVDGAGHPLAAIVIRQVDPKISLADVIGMCRDIDSNVIAIIEKPAPQPEPVAPEPAGTEPATPEPSITEPAAMQPAASEQMAPESVQGETQP